MDKSGVSMALLAMTSTGVQQFEVEQATRIASSGNDRLAEAIRRHPTRYAGLATIPVQDPKRAVKELERAITKLQLERRDDQLAHQRRVSRRGEILADSRSRGGARCHRSTSIRARRRPRMAAPYRKYQLEHAIWGYAVEVGLHAVRLIMSGVFDRYPKLRIVIGHMGENIPYALYRLDWMHGHFQFDRPKLQAHARASISVRTSHHDERRELGAGARAVHQGARRRTTSCGRWIIRTRKRSKRRSG